MKYADLKAHVYSVREKLLSAALMILRGWVVAGRPTHKLKAWGSFQSWSNVVREVVVFAGMPDPGETRLKLQTVADRDAANMETIIDGLQILDAEGRGLTAADVVKKLKTDDLPDALAEFRSAVEELCGKLCARILGCRFRHFARRNFGGKILDKAPPSQGKNRWVVMAAASPTRPNDVHHVHDVNRQTPPDGGHSGHVSARPTSQTSPPTLYDSTSIDAIFK